MQTKPQIQMSSSLHSENTCRPDIHFLLMLIGIILVNGSSFAKNLPMPLSAQSMQPTQEKLEWVGSPVGKQGEPWFVCLIISGSRLTYTSKIYAIQARNQSWTAEWRRHRPKPFKMDEGVGLVTTYELAQVHEKLEQLAQQTGLATQITESSPPCDLDRPQRRTKQSEYLAEIWLRRKDPKQKKYTWSYWSLNHPHLTVDQTANLMIQSISSLVDQVAEEAEDLDGLLTSKDSGLLLLTVTAPSQVWLNGVNHGQWPRTHPLRLAPGVYQVRVKPNRSSQNEVVFEGLEIAAGTKTKFKVEVE